MDANIDKCQSLNSPVLINGFSRNRKLRAEALGWDGWREKSFDANQSLLTVHQRKSVERRMKMDWTKGILIRNDI